MNASIDKFKSIANFKTGEEDDEEIPFDAYLTDSSSDDSLGDEDGGGGGGVIGAVENSEPIKKSPQDLIDNSLTSLLEKMKQWPEPSDDDIDSRAVEFGEQTRHKTLIFDMDETLVHAEILPKGDPPIEDVDFKINLSSKDENGNDDEYVIYVKMRPFYDECMENLSKYYEIAVFTAGEEEYANAILDMLDQDKIIQHRLYRQHCICIEDKYYVKDLRIIKDRDLDSVILVDNSIISFAYNMDNGVPCAAFYRWTKNDEELLYMHSYLNELFHMDDIRDHNRDKFKLKAIQDGDVKENEQ